eukprot:1315721-Rhodomonas_salina.1
MIHLAQPPRPLVAKGVGAEVEGEQPPARPHRPRHWQRPGPGVPDPVGLHLHAFNRRQLHERARHPRGPLVPEPEPVPPGRASPSRASLRCPASPSNKTYSAPLRHGHEPT